VATVRDGDRSVLVVVDVQNGVMREAWDARRVIANIARAVERARAARAPVIWVQHADDELPHGTADWEIVPELVPADGEARIDKGFNSSFEETDLDDTLAKVGATRIALAGAATNWCVRATAYGALDRGYDLTLIRDGHTTGSMELGDGIVVDAASVINDLNAVMTWVTYPGRVSTTATAAEVDF
jgi:nicotinamidase-related amidase